MNCKQRNNKLESYRVCSGLYVIKICVLYAGHVHGQKIEAQRIKQILKKLFLTCLMLKI